MQLIIGLVLIAANTVIAAALSTHKTIASLTSTRARVVAISGYFVGGAAAFLLCSLVPGMDPVVSFLVIALHFVWTMSLFFVLSSLAQRVEVNNRVDIGDKDPPVVRLVNSILVDAIRKKATNIVIDSNDEETWVSFMVDGDPVVVMRPDRKLHPHIINRVMTMAGLGYSEYGLVSQGHIHLLIGKNQEQFFNVYLKKGSGDQPAAHIELTDGTGLPYE